MESDDDATGETDSNNSGAAMKSVIQEEENEPTEPMTPMELMKYGPKTTEAPAVPDAGAFAEVDIESICSFDTNQGSQIWGVTS